MQIARIIRAVELMGENSSLDDDLLIEKLLIDGFTLAEANQLVLFVPSAFARPELEKLGDCGKLVRRARVRIRHLDNE